MKAFPVQTSIRATPERILALLTDVVGKIALGDLSTLYPKTSAGRSFPVKVTELKPAQRTVWTGGMPLELFANDLKRATEAN